jgi:hypothetical protein
MPRPPADPSGAKQTICIALTPAALEALDTMIDTRTAANPTVTYNRSTFIERLLHARWNADQKGTP